MIVGYSRNTDHKALCVAKESNGAIAAHLLTCIGTIPVHDAAMKNCDMHFLQSTALSLMDSTNKIMDGPGATDLNYASALLTETLKDQHEYGVTLAQTLGQRFYLCGCSVYGNEDRYRVIPFGSGCVYSFYDGKLIQRALEKNRTKEQIHQSILVSDPEITPEDALVRLNVLWAAEEKRQGRAKKFVKNPIGGIGSWTPHIYECKRFPEMHLLFTSHPLPDLEQARTIIQQNITDNSHPDTVSLLLRQEIEKIAKGGPIAVMELTLTTTEGEASQT